MLLKSCLDYVYFIKLFMFPCLSNKWSKIFFQQWYIICSVNIQTFVKFNLSNFIVLNLKAIHAIIQSSYITFDYVFTSLPLCEWWLPASPCCPTFTMKISSLDLGLLFTPKFCLIFLNILLILNIKPQSDFLLLWPKTTYTLFLVLWWGRKNMPENSKLYKSTRRKRLVYLQYFRKRNSFFFSRFHKTNTHYGITG